MTPGYTPHDLAILIPVLGRAHHIPPLLASIDATVPGARVVFLASPSDEAVIAAALHAGREVRLVPWQATGDFARKTNHGYRCTTEPLLFVGASDLEFTPGWFKAAIAYLNPGVGIVGTNDMCNPRVMRGEHATHFLVTREYADQRGILDFGPDGRPIDRPGMVLCEQYAHEFCDDDAVATAKARGCWAMSLDSVVVHRHPLCGEEIPDPDSDGSGTPDPVYARQRERMRESWPLFRQRRRLWTGKPAPRRRHPAGRRR